MAVTRLGPGGYPIAALAEAAVAATQTHYRFRTDANAVDATPTWGANEDADYNPPAFVNFLSIAFSI